LNLIFNPAASDWVSFPKYAPMAVVVKKTLAFFQYFSKLCLPEMCHIQGRRRRRRRRRRPPLD